MKAVKPSRSRRRRAPKKIVAYTHPAPTTLEEPDTAPGPYYISARAGARTWLLSGPYPLHAEALALVDTVRALANAADALSAFYSFGTLRMAADFNQPGSCQKCGYDLQLQKDENPHNENET